MNRPAVYMALCYVAGIVIGLNYNWFIILGVSIFYLIVLTVKGKDSIKTVFFSLCILSLGIFRIFFVNHNINHIEKLFDDQVHIVGIVNQMDYYDDTVRLNVSIRKVGNQSIWYGDCHMQISSKNEKKYRTGDWIEVKGLPETINKPSNPGGFNSHNYYYAKKTYYKMYAKDIQVYKKKRISIRRNLEKTRELLARQLEQIYSGNEEDILKKMLLGIKGNLSQEVIKQYKVAGISHLLAISGLHVSILGMSLFSLLSQIIKKRKIAIIVTILFLWSYCGITGFSTSTVRATIMLTLLMSAELRHERYDSLSAIAFSSIVILAYSPYQLLDVGFLLSFGAVLGIVTLSPKLNQSFNKNNNPVISLLVATGAASLFTYPIIAFFFYQIPVYALVVNVIVIPFVTIVLYSCILGVILSFINIYLGVMMASMSFFILKYIEKICIIVSKLPFSIITIGQPKLWQIAIYYGILGIYLYKKKNRWIKYIEALLWCSLILSIIFQMFTGHRALKITCLSVGQGDCTALECGKKVYLIDAGGDISSQSDENVGKKIVLPFLYAKGYDKIDGIFISHTDFDHIYGLIEIIDDIEVGFIGLPYPYMDYEDELLLKLKICANEKEIPIHYFKQGDSFRLNNMELLCLYPNVNDVKFDSNNDRSNTFLLSYNHFTMLLTGDIEQGAEALLVKRVKDLEVDVLKVPHHGSKTSSSHEFLKRVSPTVATFSYGEHNYFGHPSFEVVSRYDTMHIDQYHIAYVGCIEILAYENQYKVTAFESKREEVYPCKR